jgi:soluble lytic murein transglycosylase-like protein
LDDERCTRIWARRYDDIIRQQARDKDLDPSLIAGVIYVESRFRALALTLGNAHATN